MEYVSRGLDYVGLYRLLNEGRSPLSFGKLRQSCIVTLWRFLVPLALDFRLFGPLVFVAFLHRGLFLLCAPEFTRLVRCYGTT